MSGPRDLVDRVRAALGNDIPPAIGIAVSGGGDSLALMDLLHKALELEGTRLRAATVDHGLRPEAADEARHAGQIAAQLGIPHDVLSWDGTKATSNMQDAARQARYRLLTEWAAAHDLPTIALGHTRDDQAETVLMRLGRAAGVDGLSAMAPRRVEGGVELLRPLLDISREDLRAHLGAQGIAWCDDPSNDDPRFERVRVRQAIRTLAPLGIDSAALAQVAGNMARSRAALDWAVTRAAHGIVSVDAGDLLFDRAGLSSLPEELARRLFARAVAWIAGDTYPPRRTPLMALVAAAIRGEQTTLGGCRLLQTGDTARLCRERQAVEELESRTDAVWDGRWRLTGPYDDKLRIRALGDEGLKACKAWRETGRPRDALVASPAVWKGDRLVAAPLAGLENGWQAVCDTRGAFLR
ncbi:tRNA lysidine(34) synthetase TilS [Chachezhania antarctica]|uniref:tRNA lysidine(34) synthetase TilS n=1 Tax=Chachezhania antarctica TaxID=2340860 RepID=UPI000EB37CD1|nr:tRNA lysidine(34) synthetase TilS [Chachezhania antarctica]|tara:strand:- start:1117 stop:2349 length:1233 start_codon:yes stop_codon:yes gene_type:complete